MNYTAPVASVWAVGNGNWSNSNNWTGPVPSTSGAVAIINAPSTSPISVILDAPQTVGELQLGTTNATSVLVSGTGSNTLTFNNYGNGASILVYSGSHEIEAPVVLADNLTVMRHRPVGLRQFQQHHRQRQRLPLDHEWAGHVDPQRQRQLHGRHDRLGRHVGGDQRRRPARRRELGGGAGGVFLFDPTAIVAAPVSAVPAAGVAAVPEPSGLALLLAAVLAAGAGYWKRFGETSRICG